MIAGKLQEELILLTVASNNPGQCVDMRNNWIFKLICPNKIKPTINLKVTVPQSIDYVHHLCVVVFGVLTHLTIKSS